MKCQRCGGPPPVEGETYRHFWPCGCAVVPRVTTEPIGDPIEWVYLATGHGACGEHPTREGAIAAWRAALGPYRAPRQEVTINLTTPTLPTSAEISRVVREGAVRYIDWPARRPTLADALGAPQDKRTLAELNRVGARQVCPCQYGVWYVNEGELEGSCRCGRSRGDKT